jgi:hypothetical protein
MDTTGKRKQGWPKETWRKTAEKELINRGLKLERAMDLRVAGSRACGELLWMP